jgi:serine/threonine protein kinase
VYLARFDDSRIPTDIPRQPSEDDLDAPPFLYGWQDWGRIVVKVVAGAGADTIARLEAEADILAAVRPVNFPKLLYANHFAENPVTEERLTEPLYLTVEEFIEGSPLEDICSHFVGDEKRTAELALGIANALMPLWVHPKLFVHRDIKPPNVLIRSTGEVVMIDLGIVRETGAKGVTETGYIAPHTPGYAAPEQLKADKALICFKTDFFAIGVVMYQLMSGAQPFRWDPNMDRFDVAVATLKHDPKPLTAICGASQAFSDFVEKAMQKEQFKRQRTPDIFLAELQVLCGLGGNHN